MYINADMRSYIISCAATLSYYEALLEHPPERLHVPVRDAKMAKAYPRGANATCGRVLDELMREVDEDQAVEVVRYSTRCDLRVVPNERLAAKRELIVVDPRDIEALLKESISDCALCLKTGKEIKRCDKRKRLLRLGIMPKSDQDCPYQGNTK